MRQVVARLLAWGLLAATAMAGEPAARSFDPIACVGGIEVFVKEDFHAGANLFRPEGAGAASLERGPQAAVSGRGLRVQRSGPGGYFGARTTGIAVRGTPGLKIAFCVRAEGMEHVTVNFFDALRPDNTTPASPARTKGAGWRPVVFAVEDFRCNSDPPHVKVKPRTEFTALMFHGQEGRPGRGAFAVDKLMVYRGTDTQPPEPPVELKATVRGDGKVELSWKEPDDNAFPAVYGVFRKRLGGPWEKIGESVLPDYVDAAPAAGPCVYRVAAADYDNNLSGPSADARVEVRSAATAAADSPQARDRRNYAANVRRIHAAGRGKVRHDVFLFAGDSITAADVYTYTLGGWLGRGVTVRRGVGQMRTDFGKAMIGKYLEESRPEFAIVMYGTNDAKDPDHVGRAMANLGAVIDACAAAGTVPVLATIPPRGYDPAKQGDQARFNLALVELCRARKVPVSYCFEEMIGRDLKEMLSDGVHLTPGPGNDAAGEALGKTMEQVYFALRDPSADW
jgi:hypothetical protein